MDRIKRLFSLRSMQALLFYIPIILIILYVSPIQAQLINGDFSGGLNGWNKEGDVTVEDGVAILRTGGPDGLWETLLSTDFTVTGDSLTFRYYFDVVGPDGIIYPDFESFPLDSFQVTLDAGGPYYYFEPLAWNPTGGFMPFHMDISSITSGTNARLTFSLLDQDDGYRSIAGIDDITDPAKPVPEPGTLIVLGSGLIGVFIYGRSNKNAINMREK